MMTLREVSRFFDRVPVSDPDTGAELFLAQFSNYDGSRRDAYSAYRRVMSTDPEIMLPPGRCVSAMGKVWILGDDHPDGWEELHRRKYVAHRAAGLASIWSLGDYLEGNPETLTWGDLQWIADTAEEGESSQRPSMYAAILPEGTEVAQYSLVQLRDMTMLVHSAAYHASGFVEARGLVQQRLQPETANLVHRVYSPRLGRYEETLSQDIPVFHARWQQMFVYRDQLDLRFQEGDEAFAIPASVPVKNGDVLLHAGVRYQVQASVPLEGALILHGRPAR